jgi:hypothetical protein
LVEHRNPIAEGGDQDQRVGSGSREHHAQIERHPASGRFMLARSTAPADSALEKRGKQGGRRETANGVGMLA